MVLFYIGASAVGAIVGGAAFGVIGAILGATVFGMMASVFILNRE